jgi:hypothetical protein
MGDFEDEIRPPDKPIRECLLPSYDPEFSSINRFEEEQIRKAIEESETDFNYEFELAVLESTRLAKEREERSTHFARFRPKITQFMRIDKANEEFYSQLIAYMEMYEYGDIQSMNVNTEFYAKYRKMLDNMRLVEEDRNRLLEFIRVE